MFSKKHSGTTALSVSGMCEMLHRSMKSTKNLSFLLGLVMGVCRELSGTLACFIILVSSRLQYKSSLRVEQSFRKILSFEKFCILCFVQFSIHHHSSSQVCLSDAKKHAL
ncbi:Leucine-Rich Repeat And Immunoglobulin-Like Domain-Containing Nogo Receptor-Interacting Protein 3 [Manis pentadactyla]|nr:Leucine-Rich Repeat And Immunoglobulin-Like Domain-Containing Nogo Receptor-Interacting Protein 3 [Manis pentadactyla]